ncbi:hypothetical protein MMC22_003875, partial [Lobaria immixta]|nr:hypothetical protein [Lobaria immixta]
MKAFTVSAAVALLAVVAQAAPAPASAQRIIMSHTKTVSYAPIGPDDVDNAEITFVGRKESFVQGFPLDDKLTKNR